MQITFPRLNFTQFVNHNVKILGRLDSLHQVSVNFSNSANLAG